MSTDYSVCNDCIHKDTCKGENSDSLMTCFQRKKVREKQLEYALLLMVYQYCVDNNALDHSFMCAGEEAFRVLGITLRTPVSEIERRIDELESEGY